VSDLAAHAVARPRSFTGAWRAAALAALLSLGAAWVHLAYWESHWSEWWGYGVFFIATGAGQALFAPAVVRWPRPWLLYVGIFGNLAIVLTYVISRTEGLPIGTHEGAAERAGRADLATTAAEILLVGVLLAMVGRTGRRVVINVMLLTGALLWALRITGYLP
jgi:hypothetical protein